MNYYNEFDPQAAQWLRNLIAAGLIPPGDVDERSIEDVTPNDLRGYTQCHFFCGIAGWPLALDLAGWDRNRPVWTGSCPCQPFSSAGKGDGFADQRHLWPAWFHLIRQCKPGVVFGEQVAAAIRHGWLDLVSADLEAEGYAVGAAVLGAHSVGAPHIRQRLYFVAESNVIASRQGSQDNGRRDPRGNAQPWAGPWRGGSTDQLADASGARSLSGALGGIHRREESAGTRHVEPQRYGVMGNTGGPRLAQQFGKRGTPCEAPGRSAREAAERASAPVCAVVQPNGDGSLARDSATTIAGHGRATESAGFWAGAEWIECRDGKARPVEPSIQPLANGVSARVVRLRAYGNSIVPQAAAAFVGAYMAGEMAQEMAA